MTLPRTCLVLGASGRIGMRVCLALRQQQVQVIGVARFSQPGPRETLQQAGVQTIGFDVTTDDPASLPPADLVFLEIWDPRHHSAKDAAEQIWKLNYDGVGRVVARYAGQADFVNGCTGNVYQPGPEPRQEDEPLRPTNDYGLSRMAQEKLINFLCQQHGSRAIHLRYYHSNDAHGGLIRRLTEQIMTGQTLPGGPDMRVQVIGIEDFVRYTLMAARRIAQLAPGEHWQVNICHPRIWTMGELAQRIAQGLDHHQPVVFEQPHSGAEQSVVGDTTRLLEAFGPPQQELEPLIDQIAQAFRL